MMWENTVSNCFQSLLGWSFVSSWMMEHLFFFFFEKRPTRRDPRVEGVFLGRDLKGSMEIGLGRKSFPSEPFLGIFSRLASHWRGYLHLWWKQQKWSSRHTVSTLMPCAFGNSNDANWSSWVCMWMGNCVDLKICRFLICWWDFSHHPLKTSWTSFSALLLMISMVVDVFILPQPWCWTYNVMAMWFRQHLYSFGCSDQHHVNPISYVRFILMVHWLTRFPHDQWELQDRQQSRKVCWELNLVMQPYFFLSLYHILWQPRVIGCESHIVLSMAL